MLSKILSKSDCASCKFCCSFRRKSLWETPLFTKESAALLSKKFPSVKFKSSGSNMLTIDLDDLYKTNDSEEEVPCPFLDEHKGCELNAEEKPFDCSIWPLRIIRVEDKLKVALTPTCPAINKVPLEKVKTLVKMELGQKIHEQAQLHPDMVKEFKKDFIILE